MQTFVLERGKAPLLVSLPHDGTLVPAQMLARLTPAAPCQAKTSAAPGWASSR